MPWVEGMDPPQIQPRDATLDALGNLDATAGLVEQTGADAFTKRAIGVGAAGAIPTRGDADTRYAAASHTHAQADVTNLVSDLAAKAPLAAVGRFHVSRSVNQSGLTTGDFSKLQFDSEALDANGWYDNATNYRYTPLSAGWYWFYCNSQILYTTPTAEGATIGISKNGAVVNQGGGALALASGTISLVSANAGVLLQMNGSTDYVEFFVYAGSGGGATSTNGAGACNYAGGWKVSS